MKKILLIALIGVGLTSFAQQDRHFSMAFANPVLKNPGAAGHGLGSVQVFTNFRTQWFTLSNQPFRNWSASIDASILGSTLSNGYIGIGANMINDVSGDGKYTINVVQIPLNYTLEIGKEKYLSVGIQPGVYAQNINEGALYFDNQWNGAGFNTALPTGESLSAFNLSKFDLGAGLYYDAFFKENFNFQAGVSALHLTAQPVSFYNLAEKLYRNFNFSAIAHYWPEDSKISYHPAVWGQVQGPNFEVIFGNNFEFELKPVSRHTGYFDGMALSLGLYYRTGDAFITNLIYKAGPLSLGVGYDVNLSRLSVATNSVGAVEVFLKFNPYIKPKFGSPRIH